MCSNHRLAVAVLIVALAGLGCATSGSPPPVSLADQRLGAAKRDVGIDYLANGRIPMAIRELQLSERLNPEDPVAIHWLGEAYRRRGLNDKALEYLLRAQVSLPDDQDLLLNLAGLYIQLKKYPEAIEQCQRLIDDPTFSQPWKALTNKGWAEFKAGDVQQARASFDQALAFRPNYWPALLDLGILDSQEGRKLQAITRFEKVLEKDVGSSAEAETHYRLGETYVSLGRRDKAVHYFTLAAQRAPDDSWGQQSEKYLKLLH
jgi:type IV pilus assembly protein PilF